MVWLNADPAKCSNFIDDPNHSSSRPVYFESSNANKDMTLSCSMSVQDSLMLASLLVEMSRSSHLVTCFFFVSYYLPFLV